MHTNLVGLNAKFDSEGQPIGRIVAVWLDGCGVLQLAIVLSTGPSVVHPFTACVVSGP